MKKHTLKLTVVLSLLTLLFTACSTDDKKEEIDPEKEYVSSYKLTIEGVTATELVGEVSACNDGFFLINGKAPDGSPISLSSSKILVNETRSICSIGEGGDEFLACLDNGGFNIGGTIFTHFYSPISGTATRTSSNELSVTGILLKDDLTEHEFTLEATAKLVTPINCE